MQQLKKEIQDENEYCAGLLEDVKGQEVSLGDKEMNIVIMPT